MASPTPTTSLRPHDFQNNNNKSTVAHPGLTSLHNIATDTSPSSSVPRPRPHPRRKSVPSQTPLSSREARPRAETSPPSSVLLSPLQIAPAGSYFALRSSPSGANELRSPNSKRPPASRSCHGIDNSTGPPPALSTQRTQPCESAWKLSPAEDNTPSYPKLTPRALARLDAANSAEVSGFVSTPREDTEGHNNVAAARRDDSHVEESRKEEGMSTTLTEHRSSRSMERDRKRYSLGADRNETSKRLSAHLAQRPQMPAEDNVPSSQEDIFLALAQTENVDGDTADVLKERRRSRIAISSHRQSLSQPTIESPSVRNQDMLDDRSPSVAKTRRSSLQKPEQLSQLRTPTSIERSYGRERLYATSSHPLDQRTGSRLSNGLRQGQLSTRGYQSRDGSPEVSNLPNRRPSISESQNYSSRPYRSSHLQNAALGNYHSSPLRERNNSFDQEPSPPAVGAEGTESSVSTTAPSTVWDELDDIKSRIKRLEITGVIPSSSSNAMTSSMERPRTATTTVTTMSSSPKRARGASISPGTSSLGLEEASAHPILNKALAKAKAHVAPEVFQALEATASDALTLAKMTSTSSTRTSTAIDRQLKLKADGMCRSLTELCVALTTMKSDLSSAAEATKRPVSRDATTILRSERESSIDDTSRFQRAVSLDPDIPSSARVLSRLEARRTSMLHTSNNSSPASPREAHEVQTPTQATLNRTSTVLQRYRRRDNTGDDNETETTIRPLSRAMTELGRRPNAAALAAAKRRSREYTSQHPLPSPESRASAAAAAGSSALPVRRSFLPSSLNPGSSPSTPATTTGIGGGASGRRYLDRVPGEGSSKLAEQRQQRIASLGNVGTGAGYLTSRLATPSLSRAKFDRRVGEAAGQASGDSVD